MHPPNFPPPDLELLENIEFSTHGLCLDLLCLRHRPEGLAPAVIHLHGGAWMMYSKWPVANVFLARAGFVTMSVDYRLAPTSLFPAQVHDVKTAVRWVRAHAAEYGVDPTRIGVWGISAGGHLAGLLGTSAAEVAFEGGEGGWANILNCAGRR